MDTAVIDTNVVVSGLIASDSNSTVARILDAMLMGSLVYALSPDLLSEYRLVLNRPKIKALHRLSIEEIDHILTNLVTNAIWHEPRFHVQAPDPKDSHLWSLLAYRPNIYLVTGDKLLVNNPPDFAKVMLPADEALKCFISD